MKTPFTREDLFNLKLPFNARQGKRGTIRLLRALSLFEYPHKDFKNIQVTGTNGKGSTSVFLASILENAGIKTGLFLSPHCFHFGERISVGGKQLEPEEIEYWINDTWTRLEEFESTEESAQLSFFEFNLLMACRIFSENNVDMAILEAGVGARFDPISSMEPELSIITSVDLDHEHLLGNSKEAIAREKLCIGKMGKPLIMNLSSELEAIADTYVNCRELRPLRFGSDIRLEDVVDEKGLVKNKEVILAEGSFCMPKITPPGVHQEQNAALAIAAAAKVLEPQALSDSLESAFEEILIPGRFQRIEVFRGDSKDDKAEILLDVAHNLQGMGALLDTLATQYPGKRPSFLVGLKMGKNAEGLFRLLLESDPKTLILTEFCNQWTWSVQDIMTMLPDTISGKLTPISDIDKALDKLLSRLSPDDIPVVTGSFFLVSSVGEIMKTKFEFTPAMRYFPSRQEGD